ncbi:MAG: hypothetical protein ABIO70_20925 [Pseudomonadota bacterium]
MNERLAPRLPPLAWAHRSAAGSLEGLAWVDADPDPSLTPFRQVEGEDGVRRFRHLPYAAYLPPAMAEAAETAARRGQPCLIQAAIMLMARPEWLVAARPWLWSPLSPVPGLLRFLVEAFGVDPALHTGDPAVLARLAALLPDWHPERGTVERAREVLACAESEEHQLSVAFLQRDGPRPRAVPLADEIFACHDAAWWQRRDPGGARQELRVEGGLLRFQPREAPPFELLQEDLLLSWRPGTPAPTHLPRLLPIWMNLRLVVPAAPRAPLPREGRPQERLP